MELKTKDDKSITLSRGKNKDYSICITGYTKRGYLEGIIASLSKEDLESLIKELTVLINE